MLPNLSQVVTFLPGSVYSFLEGLWEVIVFAPLPLMFFTSVPSFIAKIFNRYLTFTGHVIVNADLRTQNFFTLYRNVDPR
jgi:hypothetical protein